MSGAVRTGGAWREVLEASVRWLGAAAGLAVNALVTYSPAPDVDLLCGFPVFGLCVMAGVLAGDVIARPSPGRLRTAEVAPRSVRDQVPRLLTASVAVQALVLVPLLVVGAATATADAEGRPGRAWAVTCPEGVRLLAPWPGPAYVWPAFGGLLLGTAACALLLRRIARYSTGDGQRRAANARAAVGAWGVLVNAPLFAISGTMGFTLLEGSCGGTMYAVAGGGLGAVALASAITAGHCLCVLLLPQVYVKAQS
ncbi:hypothetical protein [Streptomyces sp. NPDC059828]|uniref:hypothetical protein n=1 Tax=Streptomyces sp. NPDC059828 TaxID=3346965 RepID=UPI0036667A76